MASDALVVATNVGVLSILLTAASLVLLIACVVVLAQAKSSLRATRSLPVELARDPAISALASEIQELRADLRSSGTSATPSTAFLNPNPEIRELEGELDLAVARSIEMQARLDASASTISALQSAASAEAGRLQSALEQAQLALQDAVLAGSAPAKPRSKPKASTALPPIRTRATDTGTNNLGASDSEDKVWSVDDDVELLASYKDTYSVEAAAARSRTDARQAAKRLITLLMSPAGEIDIPGAEHHGKNYTTAHSAAILRGWLDGKRLPALARDFGRDQLGIGWKLLNDDSHPVEFDMGDAGEIIKVAHL